MPEAMYAGPFYGPSDKRGPDKSPYLVGVKRGLSRWDDNVLTWPEGGAFDEHYNRKLENAAKVFQHAHQIEPTGQWGINSHNALEKAFRNRGRTRPKEPALDRVALIYMEDGYDEKHPPQVESPAEKVRDSIVAYLTDCVRYRGIIHYFQQRPMRSLGDDPTRGFTGDCSELVVAAYYWARLHTGIHVPDPAGYGYSGYGNTVSIYNLNMSRKLGLQQTFEVGDCALFGPYASRHTIICRVRGTASTAVWTSHGSEIGPLDVRLNYRRTIYGGTYGDLFAIVRPRLIA